MLSLIEELKRSRYAGANRYLGSMDFGMMLLVAAVLHLIFIVIYSNLPDKAPETIPVRVLNVRLGAENGTLMDPGVMVAESAPSSSGSAPSVSSAAPSAERAEPASHSATTPSSAEVKALDAMLAQLQNEEKAKGGEKKRSKPATSVEADRTLHEEMPADGVRYVRRPGEWGDGSQSATASAAQGAQAGAAAMPAGSPLGNSRSAQAEMLKTYEQLISLWVARYKVYPPEAFEKGLQGEAVVRIRINRQGRILSYRIEQSSGHALIDAGLGEMVKRSNPVPAVPENYPGGKELEFLVPVSFYDSRRR